MNARASLRARNRAALFQTLAAHGVTMPTRVCSWRYCEPEECWMGDAAHAEGTTKVVVRAESRDGKLLLTVLLEDLNERAPYGMSLIALRAQVRRTGGCTVTYPKEAKPQ